MDTNNLLTLRQQFQDQITKAHDYIWNNVKFIISLIVGLLTVQSGLITWISKESGNYAPIFIIPICVLALCIIGFMIAKYSFRFLIRNLTCKIKIDGELDLKRENKNVFKKDESILYPGWYLEGSEYESSEDFVKDYLKVIGWRT